MASDSETYNQLLLDVGGKDGPRYFHKGLMHALALIWIDARPDLAESVCVKDLLTCPSTKVNRKSAHPLQNMNNPAARAIKRKLPMQKLVKKWNKIGVQKRQEVKNKYVAETMRCFVKYLRKKAKKGVLVVNGLTESAIEWTLTKNNIEVHTNEEANASKAVYQDTNTHYDESLSPWPNLDSPMTQVSETGDNDNNKNNEAMSVSTSHGHSPQAETKMKIKNAILKSKMLSQLKEFRNQMNQMLDEKIRIINDMI